MSTTRPIEKHLELQVAIFVVFLILGPLFVAAGALLLRFRVQAAAAGAKRQTAYWGTESAARGSTPQTLAFVAMIWMLMGSGCFIAGIVYFVRVAG